MGAWPYDGGVTFRVWAPNATSVAVTGSFDDWDVTRHPLVAEDGGTWSVDVPGALTLDHAELMLEAALAGLGIAYVTDRSARAHVARGARVTVLDEWCPSIPGLFLYYPGHRHVPPGLRAFIDVLREGG